MYSVLVGSNPTPCKFFSLKTLLEIIEYYYYSKKLSESKIEEKNDTNGIILIKEFIKNMYYTYGKEYNKKDN